LTSNRSFLVCVNDRTTARQGEKLLVALVGLPNSGKTLIARKISRSEQLTTSCSYLTAQPPCSPLHSSTIAKQCSAYVIWPLCTHHILPPSPSTHTLFRYLRWISYRTRAFSIAKYRYRIVWVAVNASSVTARFSLYRCKL
jgi:hypothetical protein